jgi:wobble nucleotide-excising tRNase
VNFSQITEDRVKEFKDMLAEAYRNYVADGPGAEQVSLEDGVEILVDYIEKCREYTIKKEENVLSEILFNLPISKFNELIEMEKKNAIYTQIYEIFKSHREMIQEHSTQPWNKLDCPTLELDASKYDK